jgi:hypothetical protein
MPLRLTEMGARLSGDVDLFTDRRDQDTFSEAVDVVLEELSNNGYVVTTVLRTGTFARVLLSDRSTLESEPEKLELSTDWRANEPLPCLARRNPRP